MKSKKKIAIGSKRPSFLPSYKAVRNGKKSNIADNGNLRKVYGWDTKSWSYYDQPILGFLNKNIGRNFNDIKSELYSIYTKQQERYILNLIINRRVLDKRYSGLNDIFFVNENGCLQKSENKKVYRKTSNSFNQIKLIDGKNYYKREGIWYEVEVKIAKKGWFFPDAFDRHSYLHYIKYNINRTGVYGSRNTYSYNKVIVSKRQLNKREIKKCQLR